MFRVGGVVSEEDFIDREGLLRELMGELTKNNYILTGQKIFLLI